MAALSAERAVPIRCALGLGGSDIEFDDIGYILSWLFTARKKPPGLIRGGVNGLHGHSARAPVDDAVGTGRMSVKAERPRKAKEGESAARRSRCCTWIGTKVSILTLVRHSSICFGNL